MKASDGDVARIGRACLEQGGTVDIEGLGTFRPERRGGFAFVPRNRPKVFLAYVVEDRRAAERLYDALQQRGFEPWLDRRRLLPGQNWPRAIEQAISVSDFFVACLSKQSIGKRGRFQAELRYALDCALLVPLEDVFFIPVRLEECTVPGRIVEQFQYVDLFPDWEKGLRRVLTLMKKQLQARGRATCLS